MRRDIGRGDWPEGGAEGKGRRFSTRLGLGWKDSYPNEDRFI